MEGQRHDQRKSLKNATLCVVAIGMTGYILANFISDYTGVDSIWFIGHAFAFFMYAIALRINYNHLITNTLIVVTLASLFDELTGYAETVSITEYIVLAIYFLYQWKQYHYSS